MPTEEEYKALKEAADASAAKARALLDDEVKVIMDQIDRIDELKPKTVDEKVYQDLIAVVREATAKNHSIATLKQNLEQLGKGAVALFKEMAAIAKTLG
jgi:hypothetical protein